MVKLTGIVEDVFGGRTVFRGYATLRTLYELSIPGSYQRNECKERFSEIINFFRNSSFTFFPELLFGWQIEDNDFLKKLKGEQPQGSIKLPNGIEIKKAKFLFQQNIGEEPTTKVISILIPESAPFFTRIDGNHRLSALKDIYEQEKQAGVKDSLLNMYVPFSILIQMKNDEAQKYEQAFFYLINAKSVPLTDEENLRAILGEDYFTDAEKKSLLGIDNLLTLNEVIERIKNQKEFKIIKDVFNDEIYTFSLNIIQSLPDGTVDKIYESLEYINELYEENEIQESLKIIYLVLIAYRAEHDNDDLKKFLKWLTTTKTNHVDFSNVKSILESYEKNFSKVYKVFVAMPYISFKRVNDFNKLFKEVLDEISRNQPYKLELIPIMRFRGESQRIDQRLIQKIKECDIFIADLSECNSNVVFEVGLAEGNDKPMILIKSDEDNSKVPFDDANLDVKKQVPFDMDKLQWIPYSSTGYYNDIKSIMKNNIPEILVNRFGLIRKVN